MQAQIGSPWADRRTDRLVGTAGEVFETPSNECRSSAPCTWPTGWPRRDAGASTWVLQQGGPGTGPAARHLRPPHLHLLPLVRERTGAASWLLSGPYEHGRWRPEAGW